MRKVTYAMSVSLTATSKPRMETRAGLFPTLSCTATSISARARLAPFSTDVGCTRIWWLFGRRQTRTPPPHPEEIEYARIWKSMPKVVFSRLSPRSVDYGWCGGTSPRR